MTAKTVRSIGKERPYVIKETISLCPTCGMRIPALYVKRGEEIYLEKSCQNHGRFQTIVWRGHLNFKEWIGPDTVSDKPENPACPSACGLCSGHIRGTCCVVLEVTKRCNLSCTFCFAEGEQDINERTNAETAYFEPTFAEIRERLDKLVVPGKTLVQLSGGEPTVREDLPQIIRGAREAGCRYVQLNTNGLRLAQNLEYAQELAEAGLSFVFLQFDGIKEETYEKLRGKALFKIKEKAIKNCGLAGLGVTLVPTIVPGVNDEEIGEILAYGVKNSPVVRGVHFQPASFFGRIPELPENKNRMTLDELFKHVVDDSTGQVKSENLQPSCCDHPLCGFHGDFVVTPEGKLKALTNGRSKKSCKETGNEPEKNRAFVARRWERPIANRELNKDSTFEKKPDMMDLTYFLERVRTHGFTITSMIFQDSGNIDLDRLRHCSLHVYEKDRFVPFCAHYLTRWPK